MKVTAKVKNKKTANEEKRNVQPQYVIKDSDEDGAISAAIIKACLKDYARRKALAACDTARIQYYLDKGMLPPIIGNHDRSFGLVIIR